MSFALRTEDLLHSVSSDLLIHQEAGGIFSVDKLPQTEILKRSYIINTDPSFLPGKHWVVAYFPQNSPAEFFDSLGRSPSYYSPFIVNFLTHSQNKQFKHNLQVLQPSNSSTCGLYCLFFLYYRARSITFEQILNMFSKDLEHNDNVIVEFFCHHFGLE